MGRDFMGLGRFGSSPENSCFELLTDTVLGEQPTVPILPTNPEKPILSISLSAGFIFEIE